MALHEEIQELREQFDREFSSAKDSTTIDQLRVRYLGKKGPVTALMRGLRDCTPQERPEMGQLINEVKESFSTLLNTTYDKFRAKELEEQISKEGVDYSLPGERHHLGSVHPVTQMLDRVTDTLMGMGFSVQLSPELESEFYNYDGLNYPPDHPARDMTDTYYVDDETVLRSHTTSFWQRQMEQKDPPIRAVNIGKCYRNETISARAHVIFHQNDVLYIDKGVTFADLLATQEEFYKKLLGHSVKIRVRPSYFPFVEPGAEVDIACSLCNQKGCHLCKGTGWLEVNGSGMVHPEALKQGGIDPEEYSGFAWGGGIERLCQLYNGVDDIRLFMENDLRFLNQFL